MMNRAYLLLGGNLGNRSANLQKAIQLIAEHCGKIIQTSAIYETAAWGMTDQPSFYNQAICIETSQPPADLMQKLLDIESMMGRVRTIKLGPRLIDLDILLIDQQIIQSELLELPHPALPLRRFALLPLAEIAPALLHPTLNQTIRELLENCEDQLNVQKL